MAENSEIQSLKDKIVSGKVLSIIMDSNHPRYFEKGKNKSIGVIEFEQLNPPSTTAGTPPTAQPLFPNISNYPLKGENVIIFKFPGRGSQINKSKTDCFYLPPTNIWNTPHVNTLPPTSKVPQTSNKRGKTPDQIAAGSFLPPPSNEKEEAFTNFLGEYVTEKGNIQKLLPYAGDIILEGRFGSSIRLGNTIKNSPPPSKDGDIWKNTWSSFGENNKPITIIRNGQYSSNLSGTKFYIEDVNKDPSSIYLTDNQIVPLNLSYFNPQAYTNPPKSPGGYASSQVIINSNRVIINAKQDSILLSSNSTIGLNSNNSINFSSNKETILSSTDLRLGNKLAKEPILLGDITMEYLNSLFEALITLAKPLTQLQEYVQNDKVIQQPNIPVQQVAKEFVDVVDAIRNNMGNEVKSKNVKST